MCTCLLKLSALSLLLSCPVLPPGQPRVEGINYSRLSTKGESALIQINTIKMTGSKDKQEKIPVHLEHVVPGVTHYTPHRQNLHTVSPSFT